ncbi:VPLPA-CTERM sorting domain-containing protein [Roseibium aestuarii]|uniref:VPLPA-CTERM sorting domain-containing protein n=1 Tax=Roseibium aestuarii TaxID=2600299 RepID=A0ABW4JS40_9HYPH|nr:VPLPA-CTERM sorting domain-containing protein [Roseibium aestuarii]
MKLKLLAAAALTSVMLASAASAAPVTLTKQSSDVFGGGGNAGVKVELGRNDYTAQAGGFRLTDGVNNIIAWCLDLSNSLSLPGNYNTTETPFSNSYGLTSTQKANVEKLFAANYATLDLNSNSQSAGFQLALWEVLYETSSTFSLLNGAFEAVTRGRDATPSSVVGFANQFLSNLSGATTGKYAFTYYEGVNGRKGSHSQNLVSVTPVPLPAAGALLGFGLVGLYGMSRRKTRGAAA